MSQTSLAVRASPAGMHALRRFILATIHAVIAMQRLSRERMQLAELSDVALKDLGLTRADIDAACAKPTWRR